MSTNLQGQLNNAFSFNNTFFQSGDFTQFAAGANGASLQPGYNYLDYTPAGTVNVAFEVPASNPQRQYVVGDKSGANAAGNGGVHIVISGAAGAGYKFNGADAVSVSGVYAMRTVLQVSGVNFNVF